MSPANGSGDRRMTTQVARIAVALAAAAMLSLAAAAVAQASPVWRIDAVTNSTVAPGASLDYFAQATNVGDQAADGSEIDVTATLPDRVLAQSAILFDPSTFATLPCFDGRDGVSPVAGARTIVCRATTRVEFVSSGSDPFLRLSLTTSVDAGATGTLEARFAVSGGGGALATTVAPVTVTRAPPSFGVAAFDGSVSDASGAPFTQAGGHPAFASVSLDFDTETNPAPGAGPLWPVEAVRDVITDLPPGFVGDPAAADTCTLAQLANGIGLVSKPMCPVASQVGTTTVRVRGFFNSPIVLGPLPVYNLVTPPDVPAEFGFDIYGSVIVLRGSVRSGGDYGISVDAKNIPEAIGIAGTTVTFWGDPASSIHDAERACSGQGAPIIGAPSCRTTVTGSHKAFLRNPTSCTASGVGLLVDVHADSWANPGVFREARWISHNPPGYPLPPDEWGAPVGVDGCANVPFAPQFSTRPEAGASAGEPAGFSFDLTMPQPDDPSSIGEADLRTAQVTLPLGVHVSPSSADGLGACSPADIKLNTELDPTCPDSSKIGTVVVTTPLLRDPLEGSVYLARQNDNPFGTLLSIYLVARGPGVVIKLPGRVDADPISGQLSTTFDNNPQLPFSNLHVAFKSGSRAPLVMPTQCGDYTTTAVMTGWNGSMVRDDSTFTVSDGGNGAPCLGSAFSPGFNAGTQNPTVGAFTPFTLQLQRADTDQEFGALRSLSLPPGLSASLKGTTYCSDSALAAADTSKTPAHTGAQEMAAPSCPASSLIGRATVGAGAGPSPFYVDTGKVYLAGPYKGAPLSIAVAVPAVAGPFDLGNVITRAALYVDPSDASLRAVSDPFPTILDGIPLQIKDIRLNVDRPHFMINPTNCSQMSVNGTVLSTENMSADVHSRFQVGECAALGFKPKLSFRLKGGTRRGDHPKFQATLTARPGDANIDRVSVALPHSEFLDQAHIGTVCTRPQFAAGACPPASVYGYARAITPLLDNPLEGPVYLRSSSNKLPDLVADLNGQIHIVLDGRIDSVKGGIRNTFDVIPDAPVSKFTLHLQGGKKGLLVNSTNLCKKDAFAVAKVKGQNGAYANQNPQLKNDCRAKHGKKKH